jgi:hypothetical protein
MNISVVENKRTDKVLWLIMALFMLWTNFLKKGIAILFQD